MLIKHNWRYISNYICKLIEISPIVKSNTINAIHPSITARNNFNIMFTNFMGQR